MGTSAAAGAGKTDPNSARELLCIICMGPLFRCIQPGHTLHGAAVVPRGANSIAAFNLGNQKDALPSFPSQNAAHAGFTTDFTVRLCLQEWEEKWGGRGGRADSYAYKYIFCPFFKGALFVLLCLKKRVRH